MLENIGHLTVPVPVFPPHPPIGHTSIDGCARAGETCLGTLRARLGTVGHSTLAESQKSEPRCPTNTTRKPPETGHLVTLITQRATTDANRPNQPRPSAAVAKALPLVSSTILAIVAPVVASPKVAGEIAAFLPCFSGGLA